jgi:hypothetical protein
MEAFNESDKSVIIELSGRSVHAREYSYTALE